MAMEPVSRHWTRKEYDRLVELGILHEDELELTAEALRAAFGPGWIVNLWRRVLEVYREPVAASSARFGWSYASMRTLRENATISPLAAPMATIAVADLLP